SEHDRTRYTLLSSSPGLSRRSRCLWQSRASRIGMAGTSPAMTDGEGVRRGNAMRKFSRRDVLKSSTALAAGSAFATIASAAPPPSPVTAELIEAARKEGKVVFYTSIDLPFAEKIARSFEAKYPGVAVRVERTGAERVFQRIGQEYASGIHAVDVVNSSDAAHFIAWKREGLLEAYVPEDVARFYPDEHKDPDGMFASFRVWLCVIGYN